MTCICRGFGKRHSSHSPLSTHGSASWLPVMSSSRPRSLPHLLPHTFPQDDNLYPTSSHIAFSSSVLLGACLVLPPQPPHAVLPYQFPGSILHSGIDPLFPWWVSLVPARWIRCFLDPEEWAHHHCAYTLLHLSRTGSIWSLLEVLGRVCAVSLKCLLCRLGNPGGFRRQASCSASSLPKMGRSYSLVVVHFWLSFTKAWNSRVLSGSVRC